MKKIIVGVLISILVFTCTACTSKEVKSVIDEINQIDVVTLDSKETLDSILENYEKLSDEDKERVENYDKLQDAFDKYEQLIQQETNNTVALVQKYDYESYDKARQMINTYYKYMTDEQKEISLVALGRLQAPNKVEEKIIPSLKSPKSFNLYSCEVWDYPTYDEESDTYSVLVKMKYGATNSFGGEVTNTVSAFCEYKIDIDTMSVDVTNITIFDF